MENTESLDADVILPGAEFRRMRAEIEALNGDLFAVRARIDAAIRALRIDPVTFSSTAHAGGWLREARDIAIRALTESK